MRGRFLVLFGVLAVATGGVTMALWSGVPTLQENAESVDFVGDGGQMPRVVLEESEADLGVLDKLAECSHVFWVRNEGTAPLELERGRTTCTCMMSDLPPEPIPPGGRAAIRVGAKATAKHGPFDHTAFVLTNDPEQKSFSLRITGITCVHLGTSPEELSFPVMERDQTYTGRAVLYTQVWEKFEISEVKPSLAELAWEMEPATAKELQELQARAGYAIRLTVPPGQKAGSFREWLEFRIAAPGAESEDHSVRLNLVGSVPSPVEVFGARAHDGRYKLDLEEILADEGLHRVLTMKINDEHRRLSDVRLETRPDFMRASLTPLRPDSPESGVYRIDIEIPPDSPPGSYYGESKGTIHVETDHPAVPTIEFDVEFIIVPR